MGRTLVLGHGGFCEKLSLLSLGESEAGVGALFSGGLKGLVSAGQTGPSEKPGAGGRGGSTGCVKTTLLVGRPPCTPNRAPSPAPALCRPGSSTDHMCAGFGNQKLKISTGFSSSPNDPSAKLSDSEPEPARSHSLGDGGSSSAAHTVGFREPTQAAGPPKGALSAEPGHILVEMSHWQGV